VRARLAEVFRVEHARVVASVLRIVRDIDAAQDVVQEAFEQALDHWPGDGIPDRPGAWLLTTARRRALDHLRRARRAGARVDALAHAALGTAQAAPDVSDPDEIPDDRLRLIFTCCHPALPPDSRVALTLRLVGGLSTAEIARAFLVPEPTTPSGSCGPSGRSATGASRTRCPKGPSGRRGCRPCSPSCT
jgi:RNA polymerase sigma-70 factor (ECF subfamily)